MLVVIMPMKRHVIAVGGWGTYTYGGFGIDWCISKVIHNLSWIDPQTHNMTH
jgi:hypothetical protein